MGESLTITPVPAPRGDNGWHTPPDQYPLISCIMPTAARAPYVARAIEQFMAQDYPHKELVIMYNNNRDLPAMQYQPHVRAYHTKTTVIGGKRNEACRYAQGSIIAHWDDDDIYNTNRLWAQAAPILEGTAHITGLRNMVFYEAPTTQCWLPAEVLFERIFVANIHGGSLVYDRGVWAHLAQYPYTSLGEDAGFLRQALKNSAVLQPVDGRDLFVYVRHQTNTWRFEKDNFRRYASWHPIALPAWAAPLAPFYTAMAVKK